MGQQVELKRVAPRAIAVVQCRASAGTLSRVIPEKCGVVWDFLKTTRMTQPGRHVAVYLDDEINIEVGAEVAQRFSGGNGVVCSATPSGLVATTAHIGPYDRLGEAHEAIRAWCSDHGRVLSGPNWEIYGHWTDDLTKLRTDVFYLVEEDAALGNA